MENILALKTRFNNIPAISVIEGHIYIALTMNHNLFEPSLFGKGVTLQEVEEFYYTVNSFIAIVEDLELNVRIWTK